MSRIGSKHKCSSKNENLLPATKKFAIFSEKISNTVQNDLPFHLQWAACEKTDNFQKSKMVYLSSAIDYRSKIAGFDLDWTIVSTESGALFSKSANDWKWLFNNVPDKLKKFNDEGFRIVIFSNQAGIEKGKAKMENVQKKIESIISQLNIPIFAFIATGENEYRKPSTEMWDFFTCNCNGDVTIDTNDSFYCGDAAGRLSNWTSGKKKDFSCSDRKFAVNIGVKFFTPEEFFQDMPVTTKYTIEGFDPQKFMNDKQSTKIDEHLEYSKNCQELVILVGLPASGKSSFAKKYFLPFGYVLVNRDELQNNAKCIKVAERALENGKSVVVDNTNPSRSARAEFIKLAKQRGAKFSFKILFIDIPVRCFEMKTSLELAHHLSHVRQNDTKNSTRRIPNVAFNVYKSKFQKPEIQEGFVKILEIDFLPYFETERLNKLFLQWT